MTDQPNCCIHHGLEPLFENNRRWVEHKTQDEPDYFRRLSTQQDPDYLWIGCADSRVPANEIIGLDPGEVFVHRNVANLVLHSDFNCLSVLQYAVEVLKVEHIMVVGHYGCGGVRAAMENRQLGLIDNWLRNIKDVYRRHKRELNAIPDATERNNRLCELNVIEQVKNVCHTTIVQNAWSHGQKLAVHGLIYGLADGRLRDLGALVTGLDQLSAIYRMNPDEGGNDIS
ncbi:MAG: carbonate dehydratase [Gammaproteobacteria bacterium]|nr:carbonate dehydratase [Gammaproteobacteria bacterium]